MTTTTDIVIVGAGIIGLLIAHELAHAGRQVTIIERGQPGHEASRTAPGILSHLPPWRSPPGVWALTRLSHKIYRSLVDEIEQQSQLPAGLDPCGMFYLLSENSDELAIAEQWAQQEGESIEYIPAQRMPYYEPALHVPFGAVYLPEVARLSTTHFLDALLQDVLQAGVKVISDTEVNALIQHQSSISGVETRQGTMTAQHTILATGAWGHSLLAPLGMMDWVEPVRGQVIQYSPPTRLLSRIALGPHGYAVPTFDGNVLIGSTKEWVGFDKSTTETARENLKIMAAQLLPVLANRPVTGQWANLRPKTPDGLPLIGPATNWPGLWLNTGHFTDGINTAPAAARLLVDMLLKRDTDLDVSPYALDRLQE